MGQPGGVEPSAEAQKYDRGSRQQEGIGKGGRDFAASARRVSSGRCREN